MTCHTLLIRQVDGRWQAETSSYFYAMLTSRVASIRKAGFPYSSIIERWQWQIITTDGRQDSITHRVRLLNRYFADDRAVVNLAKDHAMNWQLIKAGVALPDHVKPPLRFRDMSAEEICSELRAGT